LKVKDKFISNYKISNEIYYGFIEIFRDSNKMHIHSATAKKYGFSEKIMHGNILNGFLSNFIGEKLPIKNIIIVDQNIKYKLPLYLDESLIFKAEVIHISKSIGVFEFKFIFLSEENQVKANGSFKIRILI